MWPLLEKRYIYIFWSLQNLPRDFDSFCNRNIFIDKEGSFVLSSHLNIDFCSFISFFFLWYLLLKPTNDLQHFPFSILVIYRWLTNILRWRFSLANIGISLIKAKDSRILLKCFIIANDLQYFPFTIFTIFFVEGLSQNVKFYASF